MQRYRGICTEISNQNQKNDNLVMEAEKWKPLSLSTFRRQEEEWWASVVVNFQPLTRCWHVSLSDQAIHECATIILRAWSFDNPRASPPPYHPNSRKKTPPTLSFEVEITVSSAFYPKRSPLVRRLCQISIAIISPNAFATETTWPHWMTNSVMPRLSRSRTRRRFCQQMRHSIARWS